MKGRMTKDELLELLLVERHLPLPPTLKPGLAINEDWDVVIPADTREIQSARQLELDVAVESFNLDLRNKERRRDTPRMVKKGLIFVADKKKRSAA